MSEATLETIKLYRFRIWKEDGEYKMDDDVYANDVPLEFIEEFHQKGEVFSIFADKALPGNDTDDADGPLLLILSDNAEKISAYVSGFIFRHKLDEVFDEPSGS